MTLTVPSSSVARKNVPPGSPLFKG
jgi:hypothetical protein